jgi:GDPmannose 4,6-dehydratase
MKRAIITGAAGQDGSYLAEYLLDLNYDVYGVYRRISTGQDLSNLKAILDNPRLHLVEGDITDSSFIFNLIDDIRPDEFYNLAAMSHVGQSFKEPIQTFRVDAEAVIIQLEAIKKWSPKTKYYQASTSELFGGLDCPKDGYTEDSDLNPRSPYAIAKQAAYSAVHLYRKDGSNPIFACNGILFNHSSPRRGKDFATRKITMGVAKILLGIEDHLYMGNMTAFRDEGHSEDYVKAMHLMLQQKIPDDYIVATGSGATIKQMLEYVCSEAGLRYNNVYRVDERFMRPSDVPFLKGDAGKILSIGWEPQHTWKSLLSEMYEKDYNSLVRL